MRCESVRLRYTGDYHRDIPGAGDFQPGEIRQIDDPAIASRLLDIKIEVVRDICVHPEFGEYGYTSDLVNLFEVVKEEGVEDIGNISSIGDGIDRTDPSLRSLRSRRR